RLADLDVEVNPASAGRVHPQPHGIGDVRPLRRERANHYGAYLALKVSGAHHFRDRLVFLPGERGGYLGLNGVPGNRRRFADAGMSAAASCEPASGRYRDDDGQNVPFPFEHAIIPPADRAWKCITSLAWAYRQQSCDSRGRSEPEASPG